MAVSCIAPDKNKSYPIVLGKSFFQRRDGYRPTGFVGATYRFKPSSVDQSQPGKISFENTTVRVQFQRRNTNNTNDGDGTPQMIRFQGESKVASEREFFLWFDASSQRMVLERSGIQIKQLKHDRQPQKQDASKSYNDKSQDRMKQMLERHKKKARLKNKASSKGKKKTSTFLTSKKSMTPNPPLNGHKSDSNSTRSQSQSVSPYHQTGNAPPNRMGMGLNNTNTASHPPSRPTSAPPNMPSTQFRREQAQRTNRSAAVERGVRNLSVSNTNRTTQIRRPPVNPPNSIGNTRNVSNVNANINHNVRHNNNGNVNNRPMGMGMNNNTSNAMQRENNNHPTGAPMGIPARSTNVVNTGNGGPTSLFGGVFEDNYSSEDEDLFD